MLKRDARLRKEYLYRKGLETEEIKSKQCTEKIGEVIYGSKGASVPYGLRKDAVALAKRALYDEGLSGPRTSIDDEYGDAGTKNPKLLITTSRDPSPRLQQFSKELRLMFPNSQRINRGNYIIEDIVKACRQNDVTDLIVVHEHRGIPDSMIVSHFPYGPTAYFSLQNVTLRHDLEECSQKTVSEAYPHLIFSNFSSKLGERIKSILKHLFPVPKAEGKRVISFVNQNDFISFRHHVYKSEGVKKDNVDLEEVGPRFDLRPFEIKLGTLEMAEADSEWSLRPFMNTAKKRKQL